LLVSCRTHSEELASGLLNLFTWPMMLLSGVWFSLEGVNPLVQKLALVFPLTHMLDAARKISIDGATLAEVTPQLLLLAGMSLVFLAVSSLLFRWE
jgi:ABC-2 type transport system permease protein